jgi:hypothetical protein
MSDAKVKLVNNKNTILHKHVCGTCLLLTAIIFQTVAITLVCMAVVCAMFMPSPCSVLTASIAIASISLGWYNFITFVNTISHSHFRSIRFPFLVEFRFGPDYDGGDVDVNRVVCGLYSARLLSLPADGSYYSPSRRKCRRAAYRWKAGKDPILFVEFGLIKSEK